MNERINIWLNIVFNFGVMTMAFITPLFFWNLTSEFYETPKYLLLVVFLGILLVLWGVKGLISGKMTITRTSLDIPFFLLLLVFAISTFFAPSKQIAIFGNLPRINGGLAAFASYVIFYFVLVSNLKQISAIKQLIHLLLASGAILSILSILSYAGINVLSFPWTGALNFTPTGSSFSTTAFLVLLLPFPLMAILQGSEREMLGNVGNEVGKSLGFGKIASGAFFNKVILSVVLLLFAAAIVLTGSNATYIAGAAALALILFISSPISIKKNAVFIAFPVIVAVVLAVLSFLPLGGSGNPFYSKAQNFPREIQLPFQTSWKVSISAFRDSPFWGTGPGSYLWDFTTYKPVEFNNTKIWNIRFDTAYNEYLHLLATLGALGLLALLFLTVMLISQAVRSLSGSQGNVNVSLAVSAIIFFILLALHTSTVPLWIIGIIIIASFMATQKKQGDEVALSSNPVHAQTGEGLKLQFDAVPTVLLLIVLLVVGYSFYFIGNFALADYYHRQALNAVAEGRGLDAYNLLITTEKLNPNVDLYRTDMAQTNFALANAIAAAKGPTEASPAGSLTEQDKQNIQTLLSQAITEGRVAVTLNPDNPVNWEILAAIYRQISGVAQNALLFSLDSYGRAIQKDPLNPLLRLTVGGIYYSAKNNEMAVRFFSDAINLKPDFANGYYNLAVALKEKGDLISAASAAERTVSLLETDSADYQVAAEFLSNIKNQLSVEQAKQQAQQEQTTPPAAKSTSNLENKNLPQVMNLPKPENIATPEAIKKQTPQQ